MCSKLHDPSGYIVKFASSNSNYYEGGGDKCPPYACNNCNSNSYTGNMQGYASVCYNSIIYKMPMHRKKVRIKICWIYASLFILSSLKLLKLLIGLITPWDPGRSLWNIFLGKKNYVGMISLMPLESLRKSL